MSECVCACNTANLYNTRSNVTNKAALNASVPPSLSQKLYGVGASSDAAAQSSEVREHVLYYKRICSILEENMFYIRREYVLCCKRTCAMFQENMFYIMREHILYYERTCAML